MDCTTSEGRVMRGVRTFVDRDAQERVKQSTASYSLASIRRNLLAGFCKMLQQQSVAEHVRAADSL